MIKSNYQLNDKELEALEAFLSKLPKKYKYKPVEVIFDSTNGIGIDITVRVGDKSKNITDYDTW